MNNVVVVKVVHRFQYFSYGLGSVFLGEFAILADTIEEFTTGSQLSDDVVFVLILALNNLSLP